MTKYTATFKDGTEITKTAEDFKNRLDFYNWIVANRLGIKYGALKEIKCSVLPR